MAEKRRSRRKYVWVVLVVFLVLLFGLYFAGSHHDHAELQPLPKGLQAPGSSQEAFHEVEPRNQLKPKAPVKKRPTHPEPPTHHTAPEQSSRTAQQGTETAVSPVVQEHAQAPVPSLADWLLLPKLAELKQNEEQARAVVAGMKRNRVVMEQDPQALVAEKQLQKTTQELLRAQYSKYATQGGQPGKTQGTVFQLEMQVDFPSSMGDPHSELIVLETAPIELMPHAVKVFLDIADNWKGVRAPLNCTALSGRGCGTELYAGCYCPVCLHRSLESKTSSLQQHLTAAAPHCSSTSLQQHTAALMLQHHTAAV